MQGLPDEWSCQVLQSNDYQTRCKQNRGGQEGAMQGLLDKSVVRSHLVLLSLLSGSLPHPLQLQPSALKDPLWNLCIGLHREQDLPITKRASA